MNRADKENEATCSGSVVLLTLLEIYHDLL